METTITKSLSEVRWCDVHMICSGRLLKAHRTVLSSVSPFLRTLLLSIPECEAPTTILLPDFQIEAISAVLHYIYNGEVSISTHALLDFFTIIETLNISIDKQALRDIHDKIKCRELKKYDGIDCCNKKNTQNKSNDDSIILKNEIENTTIDLENVLRGDTISKYKEVIDENNISQRCKSRIYFDCLSNKKLTSVEKNIDDNLSKPVSSSGSLGIQPDARVPINSLGHTVTNTMNFDLNEKNVGNKIKEEVNKSFKLVSLDGSNKTSIKHGIDKMLSDKTSRSNERILRPTVLRPIPTLLPIGLPYTTPIHRPSYSPSPTTLLDLSIRHQNFHFVNRNDSNSMVNYQRNSYVSPYNESLTDRQRYSYKHYQNLSANPFARCNIADQNIISGPWFSRPPLAYKPVKMSDPLLRVKEVIQQQINEQVIEIKSNELPVDLFNDKNNNLNSEKDDKNSNIVCSNNSNRHTCEECGKCFSQLRNYKYHLSVHRGTREFAATCTVCGKHFNDRGYLSSHMKIHRNRKEYECPHCPKSFNQRVAYNMHVRIHTGVKPHTCSECGKSFSRKMLLKQHSRTHSGERPYACAVCDKRFADRSNMTLHMRLHTGIKPFSCNICPKSFTKKHHLKTHLNYHTGNKPYSCPKCSLAFSQSSNMRTHFKKCTAISTIEGQQVNNEEQKI